MASRGANSLSWLTERMQDWTDHVAIVWRDRPSTYGDLLARIAAWRDRLVQAGVSPGEVIAIEGDYSAETCALLLASIDYGALVVPIARTMGPHREEMLATAEVEWLVSVDDSDDWAMRRRPGSATHPLIRQLANSGTPGLIIFTSGSTGKSKAALHGVDRLVKHWKAPRQPIVTLNFLLFDHIGGINTLLQMLSCGSTVVFTASRDPDEVCRLIERHRIELLPVSPTFLNLMLLANAHERHDLTSLRVISYGTEVMPESTLARLRAAFPDVRLKQLYGMSELGIMRSKSRADGSVWVKLDGGDTKTRVVDGILWVRTPTAMLGYLNAPSPFDSDGWMNTGDAVEVDCTYLRVLGRKSELINVGGSKLYPAEVETVLMQMENIRDATVFGEPNPIMGQIVVARIDPIEPEHPRELAGRVRAFCSGKLAPYKIPVKVVVEDRATVGPRYKKMRTPA